MSETVETGADHPDVATPDAATSGDATSNAASPDAASPDAPDFTAARDPLALFGLWLEEAAASEINDPNAVSLATVDAAGMPNLRTVLLKGHDARGFAFYTNFEGVKGRELRARPMAAMNFHWKSRRRQVRLRGPVEEVGAEEADAYYHSRPLGSRIGAWASEQSRPLDGRGTLVERVRAYEARFGDAPPRPPHWGGFRLVPVEMEFWQDGAFRLHDRVRFTRSGPAAPWASQRLYP